MEREYTIVAPDGKELVIVGPDNASPEQLRAAAQAAFGQQKPADKPTPSIGRQAYDATNAFASGANQGFARLLGLPVDTAANVIDLVKAGAGTAYQATTGKPAPSFLDPMDRKGVFGSGDYLVEKARGTQLGRMAVDPQNPEYQGGYLQTMGQAVGMGGRAPVTAAISAAAGKAAYDATGNPAYAVAASMAPTAAKLGLLEAGRSIATPSDPRRAALARAAVGQQGIPLGIADTTDIGMVKAIRSTLNDTPGTSLIGARQDAPKQAAFNRAVGRQFGANANELTPDVMNAARGDIGARFDAAYRGNNLVVDAPLMQRLMDLRNNAAQLPIGDRARLNNWVDDVLGQMRQDNSGAVVIPGEVVNRYQSGLRRLVDSAPDSFVKGDLNELRQGLISGFNRSVTGPEAASLRDARVQYKALKTVEPVLNKSDAGVAGRMSGDVPPGLLPGVVAKSYSDPSTTGLGQVSQIGSQFLADRVPRTGGSARAMVQNGMVGGGLLGAAGVASPVAAVAGAGTAGLLQWALGNPGLARAMLAEGRLTPEQVQTLATVPGLLQEK